MTVRRNPKFFAKSERRLPAEAANVCHKDNSRIRVLNICETAKGGPASYFALLDEATSTSAQHLFVVPDSHADELPPSLEVTTFKDPGRGLARLLQLFATTRHAIRTFQPELIFFHSTFTLPIMVALRCLHRHSRFLYCAHGWAASRYPEGKIKRRMVEAIEGRLCAASDVVINISKSDYDHAHIAGYFGFHRLIENAVLDPPASKTRVPYSRDGAEINLLFVGRFDRQKGVDILVEAFSRAQAGRNDLRLHLVGGTVLGDGWDPLQPGLPRNVILHDWRTATELLAYYAEADVVVAPSRWEGFGLVVPEALRAGTPVLVSDRGALPELVNIGTTGFVVALDVGCLATQIAKLDKATLASMRIACRNSYETRFHPARFAREVTQLFQELAS